MVGDNDTRETTRVSVASDGSQANGASYSPSISGCGTSCVDDDNFDADGRYVVFVSEASNLVDNDTNGVADVFMRDRKAGTTTLISANYDSNGQLLGLANGTSSEPHVNEDGCVVFVSEASNLVGTVVTDQGESTVADTNGVKDVFLARPFGTECATLSLIHI